MGCTAFLDDLLKDNQQKQQTNMQDLIPGWLPPTREHYDALLWAWANWTPPVCIAGLNQSPDMESH